MTSSHSLSISVFLTSGVYVSAFDLGSVYVFKMCCWGVYDSSVICTVVTILVHARIWVFWCFSAITDVSVDYLTSFYNIINSFIYPLLHPASSALLTGGLTGCAMGGGSDIPQHLVGPEYVDNYIQGSRDSGSCLIWTRRTTGG